jgi:hypothetical protein
MGFAASTPTVTQRKSWDCSAASLAWLLDSIGQPTSEDDAISLLGPGRINADSGLLDASGGGVAAALASKGISASNGSISFEDACGRAGDMPLMVGGLGWNHWSGVRGCDGQALQLANPAPGWQGVGDQLSKAQFGTLGPFYGVWLPGYGVGTAGAPGPAQSGFSLPTPVLVAAVAAAAVLLLTD